MAVDRFGRNINYLRISLTDKCNLRCVYCMPEDMAFQPNSDLLQDEELLTLFDLFVELGFRKFRLTGGEPTIRKNVVDLVGGMSRRAPDSEISMTTNGILLDRLAQPLREAGLARCNISVDTLVPERYEKITRWGSVDQLMAGIHATEAAGLLPIKLNSVVVRGFNDTDDAISLAALSLENEWHIRFIEMMPFGEVAGFQQAGVVPEEELRATIESELGPMDILNGGRLVGEARVYQLRQAKGTVGFISSVTAPFCAACTRARLTADGKLRLCLLQEAEVDLLTPLRAGATQTEMIELIRESIWGKPWGHGLAQNVIPLNRVMSQIGG
ncbi:MAG: GTP 3',8-cyclase MoaA [Chloroflexi bacterium]|nr:GTP 3',8-cyclase MoaA [Chloroflexota bacterium]